MVLVVLLLRKNTPSQQNYFFVSTLETLLKNLGSFWHIVCCLLIDDSGDVRTDPEDKMGVALYIKTSRTLWVHNCETFEKKKINETLFALNDMQNQGSHFSRAAKLSYRNETHFTVSAAKRLLGRITVREKDRFITTQTGKTFFFIFHKM